jgi:hypothetical protein
VEEIINQRLRSGAFQDAQDVILQALRLSDSCLSPVSASHSEAKNMVELFAPLRGLNLDFERDPDTGRDIEL